MRTIRSIYYWSMALIPLLGLFYLLGAIVVMFVGEYSTTSILWYMAMAYVVYHFLLRTAVYELKRFRKEVKQ